MSKLQNLYSFFEFANGLANEIDTYILSNSKNIFSAEYMAKDYGEIVTEADKYLHDYLTCSIQEKYPSHCVLSEEMNSCEMSKVNFENYTWILDPIDGSANLVRGNDMFASAISLVYKSEIILSLVTSPSRKERFSAMLGQGAWLNGETISVSKESNINNSVIGTGFPKKRTFIELKKLSEKLNRVLSTAYDIRRTGSPCLDLCNVACGRLDGFYEGLKPWDYSAGVLIVSEAGGLISKNSTKVIDTNSQEIVASTPLIFDELNMLLNN